MFYLGENISRNPGKKSDTRMKVRARQKVAVMVLAFVVVFAICFLPYHVFMIWFYYSPTAEDDYNAFWHTFRIVGFCLTFMNSCVNPLALYCVSGTFRQHFNRYLLCRVRGQQLQSGLRECRGTSVSLSVANKYNTNTHKGMMHMTDFNREHQDRFKTSLSGAHRNGKAEEQQPSSANM